LIAIILVSNRLLVRVLMSWAAPARRAHAAAPEPALLAQVHFHFHWGGQGVAVLRLTVAGGLAGLAPGERAASARLSGVANGSGISRITLTSS
jgi:hypothetical protein